MPDRDLTIRPATPDDSAAIAAIYADAVQSGTASFELTPPDATAMGQRLAALLDGGFPYLVAQSGGTIVGYAYAGAYRPRPAYRFTVEDSVYVARPAHGRGVGRALLAALIAEAEACGFRQMIAVIGDEASAGSIALHKAMGFDLVGTFKAVGWKFGRWRATVLMQRALGPGDTEPPPEGR
ncbi:GNAT family N-acetyltransferase [Microbaculum marinisediminis]|uniref:N-acetyltransferase family protein n=1 Tax=Microbaculum marinisediminis TaxID=2931392 RepID=A0AAW5QWH2_9HYPH|nr:GNAT family N-acetyltransferase [Microbaculum sp. A6E488]MCT8972300.1 N-acetyltransferase family protein [Microbaculum sp. A6E488]